MCGTILSSFEYRKQAMRIHEAELALAQFSHSVATRWAFFRPAISLYEGLECAGGQLATINREVSAGVDELDEIIVRAKENLRGVRIKPAELDLRELLDDLVNKLGVKAELECERPLLVTADA